MGLILNFLVQTIVWYGVIGVIIFGAAGTLDYFNGWLYICSMVALSIGFGTYAVRVDPGPVSYTHLTLPTIYSV